MDSVHGGDQDAPASGHASERAPLGHEWSVNESATMVSRHSGHDTLSNSELDSSRSLAGSGSTENSSTDLYIAHTGIQLFIMQCLPKEN